MKLSVPALVPSIEERSSDSGNDERQRRRKSGTESLTVVTV